MAIPRRALGNTGLEVSILGFGASPLGSVFGQPIDEDEGVRSVHEAFKLGINLFDTSPFYGDTKSETVLGRALVDLPRDKIVVCTKVGQYGNKQFDFSAERVKRSVTESLDRLQCGYIDIIHCHDIEFVDLQQIVSEALPALQELKAQGLVRHIGITGLPLSIFKWVLDRCEPGTLDAVLSYCHNCMIDMSLQDVIPYLQSKQVGVINASPLSMGLLTPQGPPDWHPAPQAVKDACTAAASLCEDRGADFAKLALKHSLRSENVATTLSGMCTCAMVRDNVRTTLEAVGVADVPATQASDEREVEAALQAIFEPIMGTTWPSGKPENQ